MTRRNTALAITLAQIVAATILEICGYAPHDQVLLTVFFGVYALVVKEEATP